MSIRSPLPLLSAWLASAPALAAPSRVAVLPAEVDASAAAELPNVFDDVVLTEVARQPGVTVLGAEDIAAVLSFEQQRQLLACDGSECWTSLAGALGADWLVAMKVARVGAEWAITAKLVDLGRMLVAARTSDFVPGDAKALLTVTPALVTRLFASALAATPAGADEGVGRARRQAGVFLTVGGAALALTGALLLSANTAEDFDRPNDRYTWQILNRGAVVAGAALYGVGLAAAGVGSGQYVDGRAQGLTGDPAATGTVGYRLLGWVFAGTALLGPALAAVIEFPERFELANITGWGGTLGAVVVFGLSMFAGGTATTAQGQEVPMLSGTLLPSGDGAAPGLALTLPF